MTTGCLDQDSSEFCGPGGTCLNTTNGWSCACSDPWTNIGDLVIDPKLPCMFSIPGRRATWSLCVITWFLVLSFSSTTAYRMYKNIPASTKQQSEIFLLCMKSFHSSLFVICSLLAVSSADRVVGYDLPTTVIYALAVTFFWVEYKLFLIVPTLSSATSIARVIAPKPMKFYTMAAPILMIASTMSSMSSLAVYYQQGGDPPPVFFGSLHIVLNGVIAMFMLGSYAMTMSIILRQFQQMRSTKSDLNNSNSNIPAAGSTIGPSVQIAKLGGVESKIRQLRNETLFLLVLFPPCLVIYGLVEATRIMSCYFLPLAWAAAGLVTIRFVYMSHQAVMIHMRRAKAADPTSPVQNEQPLSTALGSGDQSVNTFELNPLKSSPQFSAKSAIMTIARKRKKRRPKFINAMTRVEEEKTIAAMTKVEETFTSGGGETTEKSQFSVNS